MAFADRPPDTTAQPQERLAGAVERVTFHSAESGFCVLPRFTPASADCRPQR
jgi:hypothetical protein